MKNRMQKLSLLISFLLIQLGLLSQITEQKIFTPSREKLFTMGFSLGFNSMNFKINPSLENIAIDSLYPKIGKSYPGITIQYVTNLRLSKYFDVRFIPGVSFGQRRVRYYKNQILYNDRQMLESSFVELPILLKYGYRISNYKPYIIGGLNYTYDFAGKKEYDESKPVYIRLERNDLYYEIGAGLDFYRPSFKFSVEIKMSIGTMDVIAHDPAPGHPQYANAIDKMQSQMWILAFYIE